jgi:hypothetical protein
VEALPSTSAGDDLADVEGVRGVAGNTPSSSSGVQRLARLAQCGSMACAIEIADRLARDLERVLLVLGEVVGDAGDARVHVGPAELLGGHDLAGGGLHERRPAEEDRAVARGR